MADLPCRRVRFVAVNDRWFAHIVVVLMAVCLVLTLLPATPAHAADNRRLERIQTIAENRINKAREAHGLKPLKVHRRLEHWATDHAQHMARNHTLVHDSLARLQREAPRNAVLVSENIARNTASNAARRAHYLWMRSADHRVNILDRKATHMGIGVAKRGDHTYLVQRFATIRR
jgi:uncharacterized protein YkwD